MENQIIETKQKGKVWKKVILILLAVLVLISVAIGGYFVFKYLFPTDKELFVIAHANTFSQEEIKAEVYTKNTDLTFELSGGFNSKKAVDTVKSISVSTKNTHFGEDKNSFDFAMQFLGNEFLKFKNIRNGDMEILTVPQLAETSYASADAEEVLSMLLGSESTAEDIDLLEGVDKETFKKYFKEYGTKLYNNAPESAFSSVQNNAVKSITFTSDVNRLLYDIVNEIKNDIELRDFMYEQTSIIYGNINTKFPYAGTLLTIPTKAEYEEDYDESLDDFIKNIENAEITATIDVEGRKIVQEQIKITYNGELQFDISYDESGRNFVQYKEGQEYIRYTSTETVDGSVTKSNSVFSIDINEWTKEQIQGQKIISVIVNSTTDTNVTEEFVAPTDYIDIRTMSDEEKTEVTEEVSENVTGLLTSFTLVLLFL